MGRCHGQNVWLIILWVGSYEHIMRLENTQIGVSKSKRLCKKGTQNNKNSIRVFLNAQNDTLFKQNPLFLFNEFQLGKWGL